VLADICAGKALVQEVPMITPAVKTLVELGSNRRLAALYYRKRTASKELPRRLVEPYNFTQGHEDVMVRCYQIEPEEGWRFFLLHKIDHVTDAGAIFNPRRQIHLDTRELDLTHEERRYWTPELQTYRDLVCDALADEKVTKAERLEIEAYAMNNGLSLQQLRFVHASIFHRCLGAIIEDGEVDADERLQLSFLNRVLHALGWSVTDG